MVRRWHLVHPNPGPGPLCVVGGGADPKRMNVAITRAKHSLIVVGCVDTLDRDSNWHAL